MQIQNLKSQARPLIITAIIAIIGIILLTLGFCNVAKEQQCLKVEAVVISVRIYYTSPPNSARMAVPTYEYYVDGVKYVAEGHNAQRPDRANAVGDVVTIKCDPDDPSQIISFNNLQPMLFAFGSILFVIGTTLFVLSILGKVTW